jgi:hypothetical protein
VQGPFDSLWRRRRRHAPLHDSCSPWPQAFLDCVPSKLPPWRWPAGGSGHDVLATAVAVLGRRGMGAMVKARGKAVRNLQPPYARCDRRAQARPCQPPAAVRACKWCAACSVARGSPPPVARAGASSVLWARVGLAETTHPMSRDRRIIAARGSSPRRPNSQAGCAVPRDLQAVSCAMMCA